MSQRTRLPGIGDESDGAQLAAYNLLLPHDKGNPTGCNGSKTRIEQIRRRIPAADFLRRFAIFL
jgi:hypothetical protein